MMKTVFLIGYMGCGKTTLGEVLARQLDCRFIDLDEFIEQRQGMTVVQIFDEMGENRFRELETAALRRGGIDDRCHCRLWRRYPLPWR